MILGASAKLFLTEIKPSKCPAKGKSGGGGQIE